MALIYDSSHSGQEIDAAVDAVQTTIPSQLTQIGSKIGDLTELETTDKSSLVKAINEVNSKLGESITQSATGADSSIRAKVDISLDAGATIFYSYVSDSSDVNIVIRFHYTDNTTETIYSGSTTLKEGSATCSKATDYIEAVRYAEAVDGHTISLTIKTGIDAAVDDLDRRVTENESDISTMTSQLGDLTNLEGKIEGTSESSITDFSEYEEFPAIVASSGVVTNSSSYPKGILIPVIGGETFCFTKIVDGVNTYTWYAFLKSKDYTIGELADFAGNGFVKNSNPGYALSNIMKTIPNDCRFLYIYNSQTIGMSLPDSVNIFRLHSNIQDVTDNTDRIGYHDGHTFAIPSVTTGTKMMNINISNGETFYIKLKGDVGSNRVILRVNSASGSTIKDYAAVGEWYKYTTAEDITSIWLWHQGLSADISAGIDIKDGLSADVQNLQDSVPEFEQAVADIGWTRKTLSYTSSGTYNKIFEGNIKNGELFSVKISSDNVLTRYVLCANGTAVSNRLKEATGVSLRRDSVELRATYDITSLYLLGVTDTYPNSIYTEVYNGLKEATVISSAELVHDPLVCSFTMPIVAGTAYNTTKHYCDLKANTDYYGLMWGERSILEANGVSLFFYDSDNNSVKANGSTNPYQAFTYGNVKKVVFEKDVAYFTAYISASAAKASGNIYFNIFNSQYAEDRPLESVDSRIGFKRSIDIESQTNLINTILLSGVDYPAGTKFFWRLCGTTSINNLRIILRENSGSGYVIKDYLELGKWYEHTAVNDITTFCIWTSNNYPDVTLSLHIELMSSMLYDLEKFKLEGGFPISNDRYDIDGNNVLARVLSPLSSSNYGYKELALSSLPKKGFVLFRTDDNVIMPEVAAILEHFGYHYNMAINVVNMMRDDEKTRFYRQLQQKGHEMCDHTPNDTTYYVDISPEWESIFSAYTGNGVREIIDCPNDSRLRRVYFDYVSYNTYTDYAYGAANSYAVTADSNVISGDFSQGNIDDTNWDSTEINCVYVYVDTDGNGAKWYPAIKASGDTFALQVMDGAGNAVNFGYTENITLYLTKSEQVSGVSSSTIILTENATYLLLLAGQLWWSYLGFERPRTWIQNGGTHPMAYFEYLQTALEKLDMNNGEYLYARVKPTYGYADTINCPLAVSWWENAPLHWDSADETWLENAKNAIADHIALKQVVTIASHYRYANFTDGKEGYIKFVYDFFKFCYDNRINLVTFSERRRLLIDSECDAYANIMPKLYVDMNNRGFADGYIQDGTITSLVSTGGKIESKGYAIAINSGETSGTILRVEGLGGIFKGTNILKFNYKGNIGTLSIAIVAKYSYTNVSGTTILSETKVTTSSVDWDSVSVDFDFPLDKNYLDITISSSGCEGGALMSNFELRKKL